MSTDVPTTWLTMSRSSALLVAAVLVVNALETHWRGRDIFSPYGLGETMGGASVDLVLVFAIAGIPAGAYWLVKRREMPQVSLVIWGVWRALMLLRSLRAFNPA